MKNSMTTTIARPYAEAIFSIAKKQGKINAWSETLDKLTNIMLNKDVANCIENPLIPSSQKSELIILASACEDEMEVSNLLKVLADNGRLALIYDIYSMFKDLVEADEGIKNATIYTADFPLKDDEKQRLIADIESSFKTKIRPKFKIEPNLIGGVLIEVGDKILDASVRGKLSAMRAALQV